MPAEFPRPDILGNSEGIKREPGLVETPALNYDLPSVVVACVLELVRNVRVTTVHSVAGLGLSRALQLTVLVTVLALRISSNRERGSRHSHRHHGRHKGRRNQQTNALNHAISFPYHIHPTPLKPKLRWIECVLVGAGRVVCLSTKLQTSVRPLSSCPCVFRSR